MAKTKVFFCDFFHNYLGTSTSMFPLNVGYVASYCLKELPNDVDVEIFKYPKDFIERCMEKSPNIVGFSDYTWNGDLNVRISDWVKNRFPDATVVFGGPNVTLTEPGKKRFFKTHPHADYLLPYQGEIRFVNLLKTLLGSDGNRKNLWQTPPEGAVTYDRAADRLLEGADVPRMKEMDIVPSPYLTGLLDAFFDTNLIPIVETNRGCPYRCTFCAQGESSLNQLTFFSLERVKDEILYIAKRVKNTNILNFADANFGIARRDMEIAEFLATLPKQFNYPRKFNTNWAKNQPKLFEMASILSNCNLIISLQSLDEKVLDNVKRTNIRMEVFREIIQKINNARGISGTEIILGLPGETKTSHIETLRQLFDWGVSYIICYNALLLEGTEMSRDREESKLQVKTKFRLMDNGFGQYDTVLSMEAEEGLRDLATMPEEDILFFRPVHWLIQFMWNYRFYFPLLKFLHARKINPLNFILALVEKAKDPSTPAPVRAIFERFHKDASEEWFDSREALFAHYSQPQVFQALKDGNYGKMNGKYIFHVLMEAKQPFDEYVLGVAKGFFDKNGADQALLTDLVRYSQSRVIDFEKGLESTPTEKFLSLDVDVRSWEEDNFSSDLADRTKEGGVRYRLHLPEDRRQALRMLMRQYDHPNKNVVLRKMTEFMDIRDLFYEVYAM